MSNSHKYAVLASGRGSNLKAILEAASKNDLLPLPSMVISDNKDAKALDHARDFGVESLFIDPKVHKGRKLFGEQVIKELTRRSIDTICLAGFMRIVHENVINSFPGRIINIHPALLPSFPGLDAQQQAIDAGVKESGCTVHFVDAGVDTGATIKQATVNIDENETTQSLSTKILAREHKIYPEILSLLMQDKIALVGSKVLFKD